MTADLIVARDQARALLAQLDALIEAEAAPVPPPALAPVAPVAPAVGLQRPDAFYDHMRASSVLGPEVSKEEFTGCAGVLAASAGVLPLAWCAYALATAWWETGGVMAPNEEDLNYTTPARLRQVWPSRFPSEAAARPYVRNAKALANFVYGGRLGNRPGTDDGWTFRGRGQAHTTGRENYEKADRLLGLGGRLVANPALAADPVISARILVTGMRDGWFTGKRLNDFINNAATEAQFANARPIINPDRNGPAVAKAAVVFRDGLRAGEWK